LFRVIKSHVLLRRENLNMMCAKCNCLVICQIQEDWLLTTIFFYVYLGNKILNWSIILKENKNLKSIYKKHNNDISYIYGNLCYNKPQGYPTKIVCIYYLTPYDIRWFLAGVLRWNKTTMFETSCIEALCSNFRAFLFLIWKLN